jgi:hypothetical protein
MQIFVKFDNKTISLDVEPSDTIGSIKDKIREKTGISNEKIQLIMNRKPQSSPVFTLGYVPEIGEVRIYPSGDS